MNKSDSSTLFRDLTLKRLQFRDWSLTRDPLFFDFQISLRNSNPILISPINTPKTFSLNQAWAQVKTRLESPKKKNRASIYIQVLNFSLVVNSSGSETSKPTVHCPIKGQFFSCLFIIIFLLLLLSMWYYLFHIARSYDLRSPILSKEIVLRLLLFWSHFGKKRD